MTQDKYQGFEEAVRERSPEQGENSARARNRTVMLTPDITGQVRARLSRELERPEESTYNGHNNPEATGGFMVPSRLSPGSAPRETFALPGPVEREEPPVRQAHVPPVASRQPAHSAYDEPEPQLQPPLQEQNMKDHIEWQKQAPIVGFLVSYDVDPNGEFYPLRSGRMIVSSELPNGGNYLFIADESVSPMHAIVRITEQAQIQVLDQLSEFGTVVNRLDQDEEIRLSGDKAMVEHGDIVRFGNRSFSVTIVVR